MAWNAVITDAGAALIARFTNENPLKIETVTTGSGSVTVDQMRARTSLVNQVGTGVISRKSEVEGGLRLVLQVGPKEGAYILKEIGVWGEIEGDATSTLIMLFMHDGDGISIPDVNDFPDYSFLLSGILTVSNTGNVSVTIDPSAYVSNETLEAAVSARLKEVISMPYKGWASFPDPSDVSEVYFKKWLSWLVQQPDWESGHVIIAPVQPNTTGAAIGYTYGGTQGDTVEIDGMVMPTYSSFTHVALSGALIDKFGTYNGEFYYHKFMASSAVRLRKAIQNGYFRIYSSDGVPMNRFINIQTHYTGVADHLTYIYTVQSNLENNEPCYDVYVRKGNGDLPTNGMSLYVDVFCVE